MPATVEPVGPVWVSAAGTVVGAWRCSTTVLLPVWKTPAASRISTTAATTRPPAIPDVRFEREVVVIMPMILLSAPR